jgi:hypothetical protein
MVVINNKEVSSSTGKYIRRIGEGTTFKKGTIWSGETTDSFEEVENLITYSEEEYCEKVGELIRERYSINDEFALLRQQGTMSDEFAAYNAYCEQCKAEAKRILSES